MILDEEQTEKIKRMAPQYADKHYQLHVESECGIADIGLIADGNRLKTEVEDSKIDEILGCWLKENKI